MLLKGGYRNVWVIWIDTDTHSRYMYYTQKKLTVRTWFLGRAPRGEDRLPINHFQVQTVRFRERISKGETNLWGILLDEIARFGLPGLRQKYTSPWFALSDASTQPAVTRRRLFLSGNSKLVLHWAPAFLVGSCSNSHVELSNKQLRHAQKDIPTYTRDY